ncbi:MAG: PD-(D/E)XK nuclease family protein [Halanaerobiales bacterium]|nr:PD-(D/E)XK nuclease family protein [Halanaerobiales bacterium]
MIKLTYGKPKNKSEEEIYNQIYKYIEENKSQNVCYITPTYQMIEDLKDKIFSDQKIKAVSETYFFLFKGLVNEVLKSTGEFQPIIGDIQKELILKEILDQLIEDKKIKYFKEVAKYPGFYEDTLRLIDEISIENKLDNPSDLEKIDNQKFKELFLIYNKYYEYLNEKNLNDEYLQYKKAIDYLEDSKLIDNLDLIIIDGFQSLNLYQKMLINKLSKLDKMIWINTDYEENRTGIYSSKFMDRLNIDESIKTKDKKLSNESQLHIRDNLFSINYTKKSADDTLNIIAADSESTEIEYTVKKIKSLIVDQDVSPNQIGLILKSQLKYYELLKEYLDEYKIPFSSTNSITFKQTGVWILLNKIFAIINNNYDRKSVLNFLKSNLVSSSVDKKELDRIQFELWDDGVIWGRDFSFILKNKDSSYQKGFLKDLESIIDFYNKIKKAKTFKEFSSILLKLLEKFKITESIVDLDDEDLVVDNLKAYDLLTNKLKEYETVITKRIDYEDFLYYFKKIFRQELINKTKENHLEHIKVLTPSQARRKNFDYIFIIGLLEGEFPSAAQNNWLVKDKERKILSNMGIDIKTKKDYLILESYLFYKTTLNANKKLYITYPTLGDGQQGKIVSSFVQEIYNIFEESTVNRTEVNSYDLKTENIDDIYSLEELKRHIIEKIDEKRLSDLITGFKIEKLRNSNQFNNTLGLLDDPKVLEEIKNHFNSYYSYSASTLEAYVQCPFKFFIEKLLKLEEIKEPEDRLQPIQIGDLYHRILFKYFKEHFPGDWSQELDKYIAGLKKAAEEVFERFGDKKTLSKGVWSIYKKEVKNNLQLLIESEYSSDFKTVPFELEFGFGIPAEYQDSDHNLSDPISIDLVNEKIRLKGKIDRIDKRKNNNDLIIYDYKLSNNKRRTKDFFEYNELQIPLYILALKEIKKDKTLMGGAYYSILNLEKKGVWKKEFVDYSPKTNRSKTVMDENTWEEFFDNLKEKIEEILSGIRNGNYIIEPKDCEYCDSSSICRYNKAMAGDLDG